MKTFETLGLVNYQRLDLYLGPDNTHRHWYCNYIGLIPGKSILVSMPQAVDGNINTDGLFKAGDDVSIQVPTSSGAARFTSSVLGAATTPIPVLHLSYPDRLSYSNARKNPRVDVQLPLEIVYNSGVRCHGMFSDISISGGRIVIEHAIGKITETIGETVGLAFDLSVAGLTRPMKLQANIRSCADASSISEATKPGERIYGVEFEDIDELQGLIVSAFINGEMAKLHNGGR